MNTPSFKNESNITFPNFQAMLTVHAMACRELWKDRPSPSRLMELVDIISKCEQKAPLLREFREEVPDINEVVQEAFAFANID